MGMPARRAVLRRLVLSLGGIETLLVVGFVGFLLWTSNPLGWAIGKGETYQDPAYQDQVEAEALYELLEREIVPAFYDRRADGLPRKWIDRMKDSMTYLCPEFNMHRMVMQYAQEYYLVAHRRHHLLHAENASRAKSFARNASRSERSRRSSVSSSPRSGRP